MAKDADNDYYYDEGTVNEQMDDWAVYEKNGQVSLHYKPEDNEVRFTDLAMVLESQRSPPTSDELADGERMIYRSDGNDDNANVDADDIVVARNTGSDIETTVIIDDSAATWNSTTA